MAKSPLMSSPVKTAVTPGSDSAPDLSIDTIFACASWERTRAIQSVPGSDMSSM